MIILPVYQSELRHAASPLAEGNEHKEQSTSLLRQHVLIECAPVRCWNLFENAPGDEFSQPDRQDVLRTTETPLEFSETPLPDECIPHNEHRPGIPNDFQGPCDRTVIVFQVLMIH